MQVDGQAYCFKGVQANASCMPINYNNYPVDWFDRIRPDILKRDDFHCKKCGVKHRQHYINRGKNVKVHIPPDRVTTYKDAGYKVQQVFLQIAHLDHDIQNNDYSNLLSMCPTCHNRYDAKNRGITRRMNKAK